VARHCREVAYRFDDLQSLILLWGPVFEGNSNPLEQRLDISHVLLRSLRMHTVPVHVVAIALRLFLTPPDDAMQPTKKAVRYC